MLHFSRIVAATLEVIDYEYYGNMVWGGVPRRLVGTMMREVVRLVLGTMVEDGVMVLLFATSSFDRYAGVQKILCKKRTFFIFYFPSLFNNSTMMAAQIRWCSRGLYLAK